MTMWDPYCLCWVSSASSRWPQMQRASSQSKNLNSLILLELCFHSIHSQLLWNSINGWWPKASLLPLESGEMYPSPLNCLPPRSLEQMCSPLRSPSLWSLLPHRYFSGTVFLCSPFLMNTQSSSVLFHGLSLWQLSGYPRELSFSRTQSNGCWA